MTGVTRKAGHDWGNMIGILKSSIGAERCLAQKKRGNISILKSSIVAGRWAQEDGRQQQRRLDRDELLEIRRDLIAGSCSPGRNFVAGAGIAGGSHDRC